MGTWGVPTPPMPLDLSLLPKSDQRITYALDRMKRLEDRLDPIEELLPDLCARMGDCLTKLDVLESRQMQDARVPEVLESIASVKQEVRAIHTLQSDLFAWHAALAEWKASGNVVGGLSAEIAAIKQELALTWWERVKRWCKRRFYAGP